MAAAAGTVEADSSHSGSSEWVLLWQRIRVKKIAMLALAAILIFYFVGIFASFIAPYSPTAINLDRPLEGPTADHWLGTDRIGRDMMTRVMYSMRTTVIITTTVILSGSIIIGNGLGLLAGYKGGWIDNLIMRIGDAFAGLPALVMLVLLNATLGPRVTDFVRWIEDNTFFSGLVQSGFSSYLLVGATFSLFFWVGTARLIRSQVLQLRERDFIMAAEALGARPRRVIVSHLLPNVSFLIILAISTSLGAIAGSELVLTWFGVGVQPPTASFGAMIFDGSGARTLQAHPHLLLVPGFFVTMLLFAFSLFGDALNDAMRSR
jgi:ABC-type dipeptide/oligopeptide/nickel transport system permease subunit